MLHLLSAVLLVSGLVIFTITQQLEIRSLRRRLKAAQEDASNLASYCMNFGRLDKTIAEFVIIIISTWVSKYQYRENPVTPDGK